MSLYKWNKYLNGDSLQLAYYKLLLFPCVCMLINIEPQKAKRINSENQFNVILLDFVTELVWLINRIDMPSMIDRALVEYSENPRVKI